MNEPLIPTKDLIFAKVKEVIREQLKEPDLHIGLDSRFDDLGLDSLDVVEIELVLEMHYKFRVEDCDPQLGHKVNSLEIVMELVDFVQEALVQDRII